MVPMFGRSTSELCKIFNTTLHDLYTRHAFRVQTLNQPWVDHDAFAHAVFLRGGLPYIWAFIDGTIKKVCKPGVGQQHLYSGHKHIHRVKYQHTMAPNGLVVHCFGPFEGRQPDAAMYHDSGIDAQLQPLRSADGSQLALYGDGRYALRPWLFTPFRNANTQEKCDFNAMMAQARICVEWGFGKVSTLFAFVNYYANQKFFLQPLGQYFTVATILGNCHTCLYGSKISLFFGLTPPPQWKSTCSKVEHLYFSMAYCTNCYPWKNAM